VGLKLANHGFAVWMTGLPCSGKSTIARKLQERISNLAMLDGDELREWLSAKDFTKESRDEHNVKVAHLSKLLIKHHLPVAVSLISPYIENREAARKIIGDDRFIEVYVRCSLDACEKRDVKGMYAKARSGEISNFTGIQDPYEPPLNPEITVNTEEDDLDTVCDKIVAKLVEMKHLSKNEKI